MLFHSYLLARPGCAAEGGLIFRLCFLFIYFLTISVGTRRFHY